MPYTIEVRQVPNALSFEHTPRIRAIISRAIGEYSEILPEIVKLRKSGKSLPQIAATLNAAGHRTRKDASFTAKTVQRIMDRAGYVSVY